MSFKEAIVDAGATLQAHCVTGALPNGVKLLPLETHRDERGSLTELFRTSWVTGIDVVQWNYVASAKEVLRGVHLHIKHEDYLILLSGHATIGVRDLRSESTTRGVTALIDLNGSEGRALTIPPGVAHGFYFHEPSIHIYGVSEFWDEQDELGCYWADPELGISWPNPAPIISARDAALPSLRELVESVHLAQQN